MGVFWKCKDCHTVPGSLLPCPFEALIGSSSETCLWGHLKTWLLSCKNFKSLFNRLKLLCKLLMSCKDLCWKVLPKHCSLIWNEKTMNCCSGLYSNLDLVLLQFCQSFIDINHVTYILVCSYLTSPFKVKFAKTLPNN